MSSWEEAFAQTRTPDAYREKYLAQNRMGVNADRFKKGQINFTHKVLIRGIDSLKSDSLV